MNDKKVTVSVDMTLGDVRLQAACDDLLGQACQQWLADNCEPDMRDTLAIPFNRGDTDFCGYVHAVPIEALRPGDRVGGRVVGSVSTRWVVWADDGYSPSEYAPGTIVLLDS
jgi:hypothetical protein